MIPFTGDWLSEVSLDDTLDVAITFAYHEAKQSGHLAAALSDLLDRRDFEGLINFEFDYTVEASVSDFIHARQCVGFFQKLEPLGERLNIDRKAVAYEKFLKSEQDCRNTNEIFRMERLGRLCFLPSFASELLSARWKIARILGPVPTFASLKPLLGGGASTTVKKCRAVPAEKLLGTLACSQETVPWLPLIFGQHPHLFDANCTTEIQVDESSVTEVQTVTVREDRGVLGFVAKDAKSFRGVVKEPSLTSYYQIGIGRHIAARLRLNSIDITDQTTNQNLARIGSVSGSLATLDLSSASDTIATELVRYLLPEDWYSLLSGFRTGTVEYKGEVTTLEKFSSMGNGYTFPLETLIFYALVWAGSPHHERGFLNAYGDDLICAAERADEISALLQYCGFTVNIEKSYSTGPFRESCGADYLHGINIRPFRLKELLNVERLYILHNWYVRHYDQDAADLVLSFIPPDLKIWGPDGYGDGHLLTANPERRIHKRCHGWGGFVFDTFTTKPRKSARIHPGDYLQVLYSVYSRESNEKFVTPSFTEDLPSTCDNQGRLVKTYPTLRTRRYKRISIYTLSLS